MLESFLINDHENGFYKSYLISSKDIQSKYKDILLLAEKYNLRKLYALFMDEKPWLGDGGEKLIKNNKFFQQFSGKTRYEIMRNSIIHKYRIKKSADDVGSVELSIIFNFFDLILYENRTVDLSAKKVFDDIWEYDNDSPNHNGGRRIPEEFTEKNEDGDDHHSYVIFVVEGKRLYVDPFLVYDNSRILTNMLRTVSKEGENVVLELPGKMIVDVVTLLKFLKNPLADLSKFFNIILFSIFTEV